MAVYETRIVVPFVVLAVVLWYGSLAVTDSWFVQPAVLIGLGVLVPTAITEYRRR